MKKPVFVMILATVCCAFIVSNFVNVLADPPPGKGKNKKLYPIDIPQTGQIDSYATGDDGDLQMGIAWPDPRFTDNEDGTVTDNLTGLIWMINANYFEPTNWGSACNACMSLADDGLEITDGSQTGDWRLPNIRELLSLIDYSNVSTALPNNHPFINVQHRTYWTSTMSYDGSRVWVVDLAYGNSSTLQTFEIYNITWCVRGGN